MTTDEAFKYCERLTRQVILKHGGRIEKAADGAEVFVIPEQTPQPSRLERCWEPGPAAASRFTPEEMSQIKPPPAAKNNL